jgi:hypothetical protein
VAPFFPLVRGWTVTPRAPALAPRVPMVRLSQAAPAEAGAGVRHSLPLLILLIWRSRLASCTWGAPPSRGWSRQGAAALAWRYVLLALCGTAVVYFLLML